MKKNLELIEKENNRLEMLCEQALDKCDLSNIIEKINNNEAVIIIVEIPELILNTVQDYFLIKFTSHIIK